MTEWRTVNIPKDFKEELAEHIENTSFKGVNEFIMYAARKEMQNKDIENFIRQILEEEDLI